MQIHRSKFTFLSSSSSFSLRLLPFLLDKCYCEYYECYSHWLDFVIKKIWKNPNINCTCWHLWICDRMFNQSATNFSSLSSHNYASKSFWCQSWEGYRNWTFGTEPVVKRKSNFLWFSHATCLCIGKVPYLMSHWNPVDPTTSCSISNPISAFIRSVWTRIDSSFEFSLTSSKIWKTFTLIESIC